MKIQHYVKPGDGWGSRNRAGERGARWMQGSEYSRDPGLPNPMKRAGWLL